MILPITIQVPSLHLVESAVLVQQSANCLLNPCKEQNGYQYFLAMLPSLLHTAHQFKAGHNQLKILTRSTANMSIEFVGC
jgi:hypothetical protein